SNIKFPQLFMEKYPDLINGLDMMQNYLFNILKSGKISKEICISDIKKIETAKKQIAAHVMPKYALEALFISLSKDGRNL
ncbi:MAG: hypothetical protein LUE64_05380, partial [Candidatus Gastranaerophilales bacterium]|nr:hypothetical protein [Candidatus Gastranaerophilales bacterium]